MAKKLTSSELAWQQPALHDIFEAGGLLKHSIRTYSNNRIIAGRCVEEAKAICEEIKFRNFDFPKLDKSLNRIAEAVYFKPLHSSGSKRLTASQLANIIAAFCAEHEIFWDDVNTTRTTVEMDTYRMTVLGKACWDFRCFLSQREDKKAVRATATRTIDPASGKAIPKSDYKSSGPKSGFVVGLVGKPGEKTTLPKSDPVFTIRCTSTKPKKQFVFVDPLKSNHIRLGDPSGYSACKLFFSSLDAAKEAVGKIIAKDTVIPSDISGFTFEQQSADANGYFIIDTDIGHAYIKASKLNEEITEECTEECKKEEKKVMKSRFPEIADIDVYSEAMHRFD